MAMKIDETDGGVGGLEPQQPTPAPAPAPQTAPDPGGMTPSEPTSAPAPRNPRPASPVLGPPASEPEPTFRRPRVRPTLGMQTSNAESAGGTFAMPGTRGARPFRSGSFGQNRMVGAGRFGPGNRLQGASFQGIDLGNEDGGESGLMNEDDLYEVIARNLQDEG